MRIVIIGAGVLGASTAFHLAGMDAQVTIIDVNPGGWRCNWAATRTRLSSCSPARARRSSTSRCRTSRGETWHFGAPPHTWLERDSELDWVIGGFGSKSGKVWIENDLAGEGATSRVTGAVLRRRHASISTTTRFFEEHIAPNTESDFAFKGALLRRGRARGAWRGMIRVEPGAQKTNAYQENRNLLLSELAHADSIPASRSWRTTFADPRRDVGRIDRENLFYLMARGLSRAEAERLIVRGFFQDVLDRIELRAVARSPRRRARSPHPAGVSTLAQVSAVPPWLTRRAVGVRRIRLALPGIGV